MFIVVVVIIAFAALFFGFFLYSEEEAISSTLLGIGGSLSAAIVFSLCSYRLVDSLVNRQLSEIVNQRFDKHERKIADSFVTVKMAVALAAKEAVATTARDHHGYILKSLPTFVPNKIYAESLESSPDYVNHIVKNLRRSTTYTFRGVTGRHISQFLRIAKPSNLVCRVVLLDPNRADLLKLYVRERYDIRLTEEDVIEKKVNDVRSEIYDSITSLKEASSLVPVKIMFHSGPIYYRSEIFDEEAFLSLYAGTVPTPYPLTYVFGNQGFLYKFLRKDVQECDALHKKEITFSAISTDQDLDNFISELGERKALPS